jgi:hypothetical protein
MVHAYNTGRTTKQREQGETTLEKAADFRLADADAVLKALYPETVKSSSAIKRTEAVSAEYAIPVADMLARRRNEMQKAAAAQIALPEKTWTPPPRDEHAAVMRAQSEKIAAQRAEEELRRQATASYGKAAAALDDLNTYFRTPGNMSFGDAIREVGLRLGDSGVSVLNKVAAVYPHFTKQAATGKNHFGDDALYGMVQNVLDSVGAYNAAQAQVPVKKADAVCKKTAPKFLTGSILAETVSEPLRLKEAKPIKPENRPKGSLTHGPDEPDSAGGRIFGGPIPPAGSGNPPPPPEDPLEKHVDSLVSGLPSDEEAADNAAESDARSKWRDGLETQNYLEEDRKYKDKVDDAEYNQRNAERLRQERDEQTYERQKAEDAAREQAELAQAAEAEQKTKADEKSRQELFSKSKNIGADFGKAFKGDFAAGATAPTKFIGGLLGAKSLGDMTGMSKDHSKDVQDQYKKLTMDPTHENALRSIRSKGVLHDMILNDPVVSGYDPQDVAMAFNEIAELAPSLVDAPGVLRPLLRKRLEAGQLADFDVKQILEMDKLRSDRDKAIADTRNTNLSIV